MAGGGGGGFGFGWEDFFRFLVAGSPPPLPVVEASSHSLGEADLNDCEPHGGRGWKDANPLDESCAMALGIRWI